MEIKIYTDGGSSGNPGPVAIGYVIFFDTKKIFSFGKKIGTGTNNFAEYSALIAALEKITDLIKQSVGLAFSKIIVCSDSSLVVNQVNGLYKIKNPKIKDYVQKVKKLEQNISIPIYYKHIPREENQLADSLVRKELY